MKATFNVRKKWRTTSTLSIGSTMAFVTAGYAANNFGRSDWDLRSHPNRYNDHGNNNGGNSGGNGSGQSSTEAGKTASPIKHVIILIGENRGLDHTFGLYKPKGAGQTISNLLSKGIVNEDGTPGPNFALAQQFSVAGQPSYYIGAPTVSKSPYGATNAMPQPNTNGAPTAQSDTGAPFKTIAEASVEKDINPGDLDILTTGFTSLPAGTLDSRVPGAGTLVGPFPLQGPNISDDDYTGDTTHRFYSDWQQEDCSVATATKDNSSGCKADLFPFVMATYSAGNKSLGNSMGFYNAEQEQAPVLKGLADRFTLSDNFHQSFMGGTGANHFMLGTGDAIFWSAGQGNPTTPPSHIANPDPLPGTDDVYTVDLLFDGNFTECANSSQPGIKPIRNYLESLPYDPAPKCEANHFYMVNNDNPGFLPDGTV